MTIENGAGALSAQAQAGETVTIVITNPDGSVEDPITAVTDANGNFTATVDMLPGTGYQAQGSTPADTEYQAVQSPVYTFDVPLGTRTMTLSFSVPSSIKKPTK